MPAQTGEMRKNVEFERTDQEQVEALQSWWRENWLSLVGGLVIGVGGILGWQYYGETRLATAAQASQAYETVKMQAATGQLQAAQATLQELASQHASSPYVLQSHLTLAEAHAAAGDWAQAEAMLRPVVDQDRDPALSALAGLRLARALWAQDRLADAQAVVASARQGAFSPLYAVLRGDLAAAASDAEAARTAYEEALASDSDYLDQASVERKLAALN